MVSGRVARGIVGCPSRIPGGTPKRHHYVDPIAVTAAPDHLSGRLPLPLMGAAVTQVLWASGNVLAAHIDYPSEQLAFWRLALGAVAYLALVSVVGRRVTRADLRASLAGGITFGVNLGLFYIALKVTTVANAVIISALQPVFVAVLANRMFGERLDRRGIGLIAVAFTGVALVVFGASGVRDWSLRGDLLALGGTTMWAAYFLASKRARETVGAIEYQTAVLIVASFVLLPLTLVVHGSPGSPGPRTLGWIALLVLLPGTGHLIMNWAHAFVPVTLSSTLTLAIPVLSTVGAAVFLDQDLTMLQGAGMAIVLASLATFIYRRSSRRSGERRSVAA